MGGTTMMGAAQAALPGLAPTDENMLGPVSVDRGQAEAITADLRRKLTALVKKDKEFVEAVQRAWDARVDRALGYPSWPAYIDDKFGSTLRKFPHQQRLTLVSALSQVGMSGRAIASVLGVSEGTVRNDLAAAAQSCAADAPIGKGGQVRDDCVVGLDGKRQPKHRSTKKAVSHTSADAAMRIARRVASVRASVEALQGEVREDALAVPLPQRQAYRQSLELARTVLAEVCAVLAERRTS